MMSAAIGGWAASVLHAGQGATQVPPTAAAESEFPEGKGQDVFVSACGECHEPGLATATRQAREDWKGIVAEMKDRGAMLSDGDVTIVVDYLTEYFGLELNINQARAKEITPFLRLSPAEAAAIVRVRTETGPFKS